MVGRPAGRLRGDAGDDTFYGGYGNDLVDGGAGDDSGDAGPGTCLNTENVTLRES